MNLSPSILFENEHVVAVDKPAGLVVHPDGRTDEPTLVAWMVEHYPFAVKVGEPITLSDGSVIERPGVVHRLDRETSGVLLLAKTQESYLFLKRQFMRHQVQKKYHAFLYGTLKDDRGTINRPIGRSNSDFRKWSAGRGPKGELRDAVTRWFTLLRGIDAMFVEAQPLTGRTHQIRVHFQSIGHPVVADPLYAIGRAPLFGFTRCALHAKIITFRLPGGGEQTVEAPYPSDFVSAIERFKASGAEGAALLRM